MRNKSNVKIICQEQMVLVTWGKGTCGKWTVWFQMCFCKLLNIWKHFWLNQLLFKLELGISFVCLPFQMYRFYFKLYFMLKWLTEEFYWYKQAGCALAVCWQGDLHGVSSRISLEMQIDHFIRKISGLLMLFFHVRNRPHKTTKEDVKCVEILQAECIVSSTWTVQGWGILMELGQDRFIITI